MTSLNISINISTNLNITVSCLHFLCITTDINGTTISYIHITNGQSFR